MYSIVLMAALSSGGTEATGFGNHWFNWIVCDRQITFGGCTWMDRCWPTRYGWVNPGNCCTRPLYGRYHSSYCACVGAPACAPSCIPPAPAACYGSSGCDGRVGYGCGACYGAGLGYWHDPHVSYPGFSGFGQFGQYGSTVMSPPRGNDPLLNVDPAPKAAPTLPAPDPLKMLQRKIERDTASIILDVPAGALVYIDGNLMKSTAANRTFTTPMLDADGTYFYNVKVIAEINGRKVEDTQKIFVKAGERSNASFAYLRTPGEKPALAAR
jgi:uncharacterized protein (TIGR03000 family)